MAPARSGLPPAAAAAVLLLAAGAAQARPTVVALVGTEGTGHHMFGSVFSYAYPERRYNATRFVGDASWYPDLGVRKGLQGVFFAVNKAYGTTPSGHVRPGDAWATRVEAVRAGLQKALDAEPPEWRERFGLHMPMWSPNQLSS